MSNSCISLRQPLITALSLAIWSSAITSGCAKAVEEKTDLIHINCMRPPNPGPCDGGVAGFYFDFQTDLCRPLANGGCDGSRPFASMDACLKACGGQPGR